MWLIFCVTSVYAACFSIHAFSSPPPPGALSLALPFAYSQSFILSFPPVSFCFLVTVTFPLPSPLSSSLIQSHHSHRSSLTLICRRRYRSALWDWRKKGLIPTYLCVCVCVWVAECMLACTPLLLVWNWEILVWIYKRIQWRCVEFSFLSLQKKESAPTLRQGEFVFLFRVVHPLCTKHTLTNIQPVGGGLWMMYGALH